MYNFFIKVFKIIAFPKNIKNGNFCTNLNAIYFYKGNKMLEFQKTLFILLVRIRCWCSIASRSFQ